MVEVFKTNISHPQLARFLADRLSELMPGCTISFDLNDCDRILRIQSERKPVDTSLVQALFKTLGFQIDILPDTVLPAIKTHSHGN